MALQFDPQLAEAYANRCLTLLLQHKDSEAQADFERALALAPSLRDQMEQQRRTVGKALASKH